MARVSWTRQNHHCRRSGSTDSRVDHVRQPVLPAAVVAVLDRLLPLRGQQRRHVPHGQHDVDLGGLQRADGPLRLLLVRGGEQLVGDDRGPRGLPGLVGQDLPLAGPGSGRVVGPLLDAPQVLAGPEVVLRMVARAAPRPGPRARPGCSTSPAAGTWCRSSARRCAPGPGDAAGRQQAWRGDWSAARVAIGTPQQVRAWTGKVRLGWMASGCQGRPGALGDRADDGNPAIRLIAAVKWRPPTAFAAVQPKCLHERAPARAARFLVLELAAVCPCHRHERRTRHMHEPFTLLLSVYDGDRPDFLQRAFRSAVDDQTVRPAQVVIVRDGPVRGRTRRVPRPAPGRQPGPGDHGPAGAQPRPRPGPGQRAGRELARRDRPDGRGRRGHAAPLRGGDPAHRRGRHRRGGAAGVRGGHRPRRGPAGPADRPGADPPLRADARPVQPPDGGLPADARSWPPAGTATCR